MTKKDFIAYMAETNGMTKVATTEMYNVVIGSLVGAITKGENVALPEIGKFEIVRRAERSARNPMTGEEIVVPAKYALKLKPCKAVKEVVAEL